MNRLTNSSFVILWRMEILGLMLLAINSCTPAVEEEPPPTMTTRSGVEMVLIPAGSLFMGDDNGQSDEKPQHKVYISSFYMDKYEVTQLDYLQTTGTNPSKFGGEDWKLYPVDRVGWRQAAAYCNERSRREDLEPCYDEQTWQCNFDADGYRLPTEAEWEYAYRAGATASYYFGSPQDALRRNTNNKLEQYAWFKKNSNNQAQPVGRKKPNRWTLYDMAGNVYEWCNDYYDPNYYQNSPARDPRGPQKVEHHVGSSRIPRGVSHCGGIRHAVCQYPTVGEKKVLRGGCWVTSADTCRAGSRFSDDSVNADTCLGYPAYGFRCVMANRKSQMAISDLR